MSRDRLCALACALSLLLATPAAARDAATSAPRPGDPAGPGCLAPLAANVAEPQLRDLHFRVSLASGAVTLLSCLVSNHRGTFTSLRVDATAVSTTFTSVGIVGGGRESLGPSLQARPGQPGFVAMIHGGINLPPGTQLLPRAMVRIQWQYGPGAPYRDCVNFGCERIVSVDRVWIETIP